ncbi:hypothetical protein Tco_0458404, partial [Tanacetum coccineum]
MEKVCKGEEFGFDSKEDEVVPRVGDVSLVNRVFDGAFGGDGDDDFAIGDGKGWMKRLEYKPWIMKKKKSRMKMMKKNEGDDHYLIKRGQLGLRKEKGKARCALLQPFLFAQESSKLAKFQ